MRLKRNRLCTYYHKPAVPKKDDEGGSYVEYGLPTPFEAEQWTAGGKLQTEMYGARLPNIRNLRMQGKYTELRTEDGKLIFNLEGGPEFTVGDGICLICPDKEPDYKVIAIYPYRFLTLEVERI